MNARTARLLHRYHWAMTVFDQQTGEVLAGPKLRDIQRAWLAMNGKERAVARRRMEARIRA